MQKTGKQTTMLSWVCKAVLIAAAPVCGAGFTLGQAPRQAGTLVIAGQSDQAPLVRIDGKSYVDIESLARITHGTVQFQGSRTILTLPGAGGGAGNAAADAAKPPRISGGYLSAEIEALTQIREWHVSLVNAVQNSYPITENWVGPVRRSAESKLQLALAAASTDLDQKAAELLRNEFTNMQQMSDQFLAMRAQAQYISPDVFDNNALDQKILGCEHALAEMATTKQYQDEAQCH
jgi:hypothetical protein